MNDKDKQFQFATTLILGALAFSIAALILAAGLGAAWRLFSLIVGF